MADTKIEISLVRNILELPLEQQIFALGVLGGTFSLGFFIGGMYRRYEVTKVQTEKAGLKNIVGELERELERRTTDLPD